MKVLANSKQDIRSRKTFTGKVPVELRSIDPKITTQGRDRRSRLRQIPKVGTQSVSEFGGVWTFHVKRVSLSATKPLGDYSETGESHNRRKGSFRSNWQISQFSADMALTSVSVDANTRQGQSFMTQNFRRRRTVRDVVALKKLRHWASKMGNQ